MAPPTDWYRDQYLVSTSQSLLQPTAIKAAFESDLMYWTKTMNESLLQKALSKSLCFGVYELPSSSSEIVGKANPRQIGLARLITDEVTFAYLTDVYILSEHQNKGLGTWLIKCVSETLSSWPELRRTLLITSTESNLYTKEMGMKPFEQGKHGMVMFNRKGEGSVLKD